MDKQVRRRTREIYKEMVPIIRSSVAGRIDPYFFGFDMPLTPIEENVWEDIRYLGLPFYMQVPAGPYFIDFADPIKKRGIEVDGKEWHKDIDKDKKREKHLKELGWTLWRIPGKYTFKTREDFISSRLTEDGGETSFLDPNFYIVCSEGILHTIKKIYYSE